MSLGPRMLRNIGSAFAGQLATTLLGVITFAVLARSLGTEGLGHYRTVLTLLLFTGMLFDFGLYSIMLREVSTPQADQRRVVGNAVTLRIAGSLFGVALLAMTTQVAGFSTTIGDGVLILGLGWVGYHLNDLLRGVFQFKLAQHRSAISDIAGAAVTLLLVVALARVGAGTHAMMASTATGMICTACLAWYFSRHLIDFRPRFECRMWRSFVVAGLPIAASGILRTVQLRIDVLLLALMTSASDVGLYDPSVNIYELLVYAPYMFGGMMMPLFVGDLDGTRGSMSPRLNAAIGISITFSALVFAAVLILAEPLVVMLAGHKFADSAGPLRILAGAAAFSGLSAILRFAGTALGQQRTMLRADVIGVSAAIVAHVILIPRYGIIGAALGKLCGDGVTSLAAAVVLRRQIKRTVLGATAVALAAGAILALALFLADRSGVNWLVAGATCGLLVCGAVLLVPRVRRDLASLAAS